MLKEIRLVLFVCNVRENKGLCNGAEDMVEDEGGERERGGSKEK